MLTDISSHKDIEFLVNSFYAKAKIDPLLGHFFGPEMAIDWDTHLPIMCTFWDNALFHSGGYRGDMMGVHRQVHEHKTMHPSHFERWTTLFCQTVDELFEGETANRAKQQALNMAIMLQIKIPVV